MMDLEEQGVRRGVKQKLFCGVNLRLYAPLLLMGLCPAVYTAVRIHFLGQMPDPGAYSIAGQLSWVNLIYEVVQEAILLPLFYFMGQVTADREAFSNRVRTGLLVTACLYTVLSLALCHFVRPLLGWMAADPSLTEASVSYIRLESAANIFGVLGSFALAALVTLDRERYLYLLTVARLVLSVAFDALLISALPFSLRLGVNGIGYSNLLVNGLLLGVSLRLLSKSGVRLFAKTAPSFRWMGEFLKVGGISGLESFVRNLAYMLMVVRMVNAVQEQGVYWVANSFIWGWLLLPVTQLAELMKQEIATDAQALRTHTPGYFALTGIICAAWVISIPLWRPFMTYVLGYSDAHSVELDPSTTHPVIDLMPDQNGVEDIGGTLRLGSYPCVLAKDSLAYRLYGEETIHERHRHRYEVNNDFRGALTAGGMKLSGLSPDGRIVEMCELPDHPFFIATQAHPELKSRPNRPHPLFSGFVAAALKEKNQTQEDEQKGQPNA